MHDSWHNIYPKGTVELLEFHSSIAVIIRFISPLFCPFPGFLCFVSYLLGFFHRLIVNLTGDQKIVGSSPAWELGYFFE